MSFPFNFALHTWIELKKDNTTDRYDFWGYTSMPEAHRLGGFIYKNLFPNHLGTKFSLLASPHTLGGRLPGRVYSEIEGGDGSEAHEVFTLITDKVGSYPHKDEYGMIFGPNCNSFTQWLINLKPDSGLRLPWNAWGKSYD